PLSLIVDLAQAPRQLGGGAQRRHAVSLDEPRDRRVIDARLQRKLPLAHLLLLQLAAQPAVEGSRCLKRHAPTSVRRGAHREKGFRWCVRATAGSQSLAGL